MALSCIQHHSSGFLNLPITAHISGKTLSRSNSRYEFWFSVPSMKCNEDFPYGTRHSTTPLSCFSLECLEKFLAPTYSSVSSCVCPSEHVSFRRFAILYTVFRDICTSAATFRWLLCLQPEIVLHWRSFFTSFSTSFPITGLPEPYIQPADQFP